MTVIRRIHPHEVDDAISLSEYAFKYTLEGERRRQRERFMSDHVVFGAFKGDAMVAKAHVIPLSVLIDDQEYSMGGIASVATYPEYRRQGIAHRLMNTALLAMRDAGQTVSLLAPFDVAFYRRYGFELTSSFKRITVLKRDFGFYRGNPGTVARTGGLECLDAMQAVYRQYIRHYNGMLVRSDRWWHDTWAGDQAVAVYCDDENVPRGYMVYKVSGDIMSVREYVYLDENSRRGLWNFLANHDSMVEKAEITVAEHDPVSFLFFNPDAKTEVFADFMGRIVLVDDFLARYFVGLPRDWSLTLGLTDTSAEWNSGLYTISAEGVQKGAVSSLGTPPGEALCMDINTLTALLLGSQALDFLYAAGRVTGPPQAVELLRPMLTRRRAAFLDNY